MNFVLANATCGTPSEVAAYLPTNYKLIGTTFFSEYYPKGEYIIVGNDVAGWTAKGYVIPRLGSGLIAARYAADKDVAVVAASLPGTPLEEITGG